MTKGEAIRLFCLQCMGGSESEVINCTVKDCPLYKYRLGAKNSILTGEK